MEFEYIRNTHPGLVLANKLEAIANEIEAMGTNNGTRQLDTRWARGAIQRMIKNKVYLGGPQTGMFVTAKIALAKCETLENLRAIAKKLKDKSKGKSC